MLENGNKVFVRTVTYHLIGEIVGRETVGETDFLVLGNASWVADSGRFHVAIARGELSEVEFVGHALVNVAAITDAFPWHHELPTTSK